MKHLYLSLLLLFIYLVFTNLSGCGKNDIIIPKPKYSFYEKININPQTASYAVGDTVWLNFKTTNKTFFDSISRTRVSSDTFLFYLGTYIFAKLNTNSSPGESFCSIVNPSGSSPTSFHMTLKDMSVNYTFSCNNSLNYDIKMGIVTKQAGTFVISLQSGNPIAKCNGVIPYSNPIGSLQFRFDGNTNKNIFTSLSTSDRTEFFRYIREEDFDNKSVLAFTVQ